jgi:UDP-glucuronate decarboxylase
MESDLPDLAPVNLGNPEEFTILELLDAVIAETGTRAEVRFLPLPTDDPRRRRPDIRRARDLLGWEPRVSLTDGLRLTADFFAAEIGATPMAQVAAE